MLTNEIPPDDPGHACPLPLSRGGYGSTDRPDGTLIRCPECGTWWESRPCFESLGPISRWGRIHWWNRNARRRIREQGACQQ